MDVGSGLYMHVSPKRCKIGNKLVLIINWKSYVTLNGELALILRYFTEFGSVRFALPKSG